MHSFMVCRLEKSEWLLNLHAEIAILCMKQWQAVVFPVSLTSLMYAGSLVLKFMILVELRRERSSDGEGLSFECIKSALQGFLELIISVASNVLAWRNFVVVSILTIWRAY